MDPMDVIIEQYIITTTEDDVKSFIFLSFVSFTDASSDGMVTSAGYAAYSLSYVITLSLRLIFHVQPTMEKMQALSFILKNPALEQKKCPYLIKGRTEVCPLRRPIHFQLSAYNLCPGLLTQP